MKKSSKKLNPKFRKVLVIVALLAWALLVTIASQLVVSIIMALALGDNINEPVWMTICQALIYTLALILLIFVPWKVFKKWKTDREELGLEGLPTWIDIGLAPVGFCAYYLLATVLTYLFSFFPFFDVEQSQDVGFSGLFTIPDRLLAFIALVIIAPIAEEIIFRGWLYGKIRARIPKKSVSIIISTILVSALFGLLHGQWNVGINVFAMSIVLCLMREVTGTIYSGILLHMLKNGVAFFLLYVVNML